LMPRCKHCRTPLVKAETGRRRRYCSTACKMVAYRRRRKRSIHFRSGSPEWSTPQAFFDAVNARHDFTLDACATPDNAKCPVYHTREQDGLAQPWRGRVWCNPPYGREVGKWLEKAWRSVQSGEAEVVVCLVFARTDTTWWHEWAVRANEVEFLRGRLNFGAGNNAPFPSALLVFRNAKSRYETESA
jgi:phage N-6-adenine-methyltransferase